MDKGPAYHFRHRNDLPGRAMPYKGRAGSLCKVENNRKIIDKQRSVLFLTKKSLEARAGIKKTKATKQQKKSALLAGGGGGTGFFSELLTFSCPTLTWYHHFFTVVHCFGGKYFHIIYLGNYHFQRPVLHFKCPKKLDVESIHHFFVHEGILVSEHSKILLAACHRKLIVFRRLQGYTANRLCKRHSGFFKHGPTGRCVHIRRFPGHGAF